MAGDRFSVADITALVTVDFAAKAPRHNNFLSGSTVAADTFGYEGVSARPSMGT